MASESGQEKRETLADIVSEIRAYGAQPPPRLMWLEIADRIEAIDSADAWRGLYTPPVGNAAAMREALVAVKKAFDDSLICTDSQMSMEECDRLDDVYHKVNAALSAPARNCDLYATATEALKAQDVAFNEDNFKNGECRLGCPGCDDGLIDCKILWLFAPAAERKGEGDGR